METLVEVSVVETLVGARFVETLEEVLIEAITFVVNMIVALAGDSLYTIFCMFMLP